MRILLISDVEEPALWDYYRPGRLDGIDLILSAGDLKAAYLEFLVTMANKPLIYVHGNHDGRYLRFPPEGCECADDALLTVKGLRILGLGGSGWYGGGDFQYTRSRPLSRMKSRISFEHMCVFCAPSASSRSKPSVPNWLGLMTTTSSGTRRAIQ